MEKSKETRKMEIKNLLENEFNSFKDNVEGILAECPSCKVLSVHCGYKSASIVIEPIGNTTPGANQIEVRYCQKCDRFQDEEFCTNLAAKGEFELLDGNMKAQYYIAAGNLLSNKNVLIKLREEMVRFSNEVYNLRKEYEILGKED